MDYLGVPYPDAYQAAFRAQRVWTLPPPDQLAYGASLPPALSQVPPTVSAAAWRAAEEGGTIQAVTTATQRAVQRAAAWEMTVTARAAQRRVRRDAVQDEVCVVVLGCGGVLEWYAQTCIVYCIDCIVCGKHVMQTLDINTQSQHPNT